MIEKSKSGLYFPASTMSETDHFVKFITLSRLPLVNQKRTVILHLAEKTFTRKIELELFKTLNADKKNVNIYSYSLQNE